MRLHQLSASAYTTPNLWFLSVSAALQLLCRVVLGADAWVPANTSQIHLVVRTCARPISFAHSILPFGVFMCILSISVFGPVSHRSSHNKTPTLPVHALGFGPEKGSCMSWEQGILVVLNSLKQKNQSITVDRKPETNIVRGSEQHPVTWTYLNIVQKWIN